MVRTRVVLLDFRRNDIHHREAAHTLLAYIDPAPGWDFEPPFHSHRRSSKIRAIELGSGTGIVGSQIAKFLRLRDEDALVVVTDLPEVGVDHLF